MSISRLISIFYHQGFFLSRHKLLEKIRAFCGKSMKFGTIRRAEPSMSTICIGFVGRRFQKKYCQIHYATACVRHFGGHLKNGGLFQSRPNTTYLGKYETDNRHSSIYIISFMPNTDSFRNSTYAWMQMRQSNHIKEVNWYPPYIVAMVNSEKPV